MKIELLYFADCPNHEPALAMLQQVVAEEGVQADIQSIDITSQKMAQTMRFLGSPSIRINGKDVEGNSMADASYGRKCRIYLDSGKPSGLPSRETLKKAVVEAKSNA
ncbi:MULTISPECIES: DF family (seleno)protein [unclassified Nitrospina]|uniref:DF family (seleno)protein n=1 Tax=unclassified Nitrospina TaxID=2638683 RepID=UPI003F94CD08